ncbi:MAG: DUF4125 family protein, partial [Erysipelotrichaceae bacterium]|nr:DUF4125 family protein [Erysipelotrichaceae bacterium]
MDKQQAMDVVIGLEWEMFQKVNNIGGRASCQDEYDTFEIMRKSQFLSWDDETVESYLQDLQDAQAEGRNLVAEKYLRMMKSTDPVNYTKSEHLLPVLSEERIQKQEEVIAREIRWAEEYVQKYPLISQT